MSEHDLEGALAEVAGEILGGHLVKATASGRRRGSEPPQPERLEVRTVNLRGRPVLQVVGRTGHLVRTENLPLGPAADAATSRRVEDLVALPYANWFTRTATAELHVRVSKKGRVFLARSEVQPSSSSTPASPTQALPTPGETSDVPSPAHDRAKNHLIAPDDPLFTVLGAGGDKRRQVDAFVRALDAALRTATRRGVIDDGPLTVVDLGCGNAYLTMAAHRYLSRLRPGTRTIGVEQRAELVDRSTLRAQEAGLAGLDFVVGSIGGVELERADVVLALHACDTATDDALARALGWAAPVVLAAPCCHHDVQRQLAHAWEGAPGPGAYPALTRYPILRERFSDVLTDAFRAAILRREGYSAEVTEFIDSAHTPRNAMIRAVATPQPASVRAQAEAELADLTGQWRVRPRLEQLLGRD